MNPRIGRLLSIVPSASTRSTTMLREIRARGQWATAIRRFRHRRGRGKGCVAATTSRRRRSRRSTTRVPAGSAPVGSDGRLRRDEAEQDFMSFGGARSPRSLGSTTAVSPAERSRQLRSARRGRGRQDWLHADAFGLSDDGDVDGRFAAAREADDVHRRRDPGSKRRSGGSRTWRSRRRSSKKRRSGSHPNRQNSARAPGDVQDG